MIHILYIPVLFVCFNGECNFAQGEYTTTLSACQTALVEQMKTVRVMAANANQPITQLKGACITVKGGML